MTYSTGEWRLGGLYDTVDEATIYDTCIDCYWATGTVFVPLHISLDCNSGERRNPILTHCSELTRVTKAFRLHLCTIDCIVIYPCLHFLHLVQV